MDFSEALKVLGLSPTAKIVEGTEQYHRLAIQNHPDKVGPAGKERMQRINAAWEVVRERLNHGTQQTMDDNKGKGRPRTAIPKDVPKPSHGSRPQEQNSSQREKANAHKPKSSEAKTTASVFTQDIRDDRKDNSILPQSQYNGSQPTGELEQGFQAETASGLPWPYLLCVVILAFRPEYGFDARITSFIRPWAWISLLLLKKGMIIRGCRIVLSHYLTYP